MTYLELTTNEAEELRYAVKQRLRTQHDKEVIADLVRVLVKLGVATNEDEWMPVEGGGT